jgi:hypothetical protein
LRIIGENIFIQPQNTDCQTQLTELFLSYKQGGGNEHFLFEDALQKKKKNKIGCG